MSEPCTDCGHPRTPMMFAGSEIGSYCQNCTDRACVQRLLDAGKAALPHLARLKTDEARAVYSELWAALRDSGVVV